jgi:hypothetical protein
MQHLHQRIISVIAHNVPVSWPFWPVITFFFGTLYFSIPCTRPFVVILMAFVLYFVFRR